MRVCSLGPPLLAILLAVPSAVAAAPIANFTAPPFGSTPAQVIALKNSDAIRTKTSIVRTPIYGPVRDRAGNIIGQKIVGYNSQSVTSTVVTPKSRLYSTTHTSFAVLSPLVDFNFLAPLPEALVPWVNGPQKANFKLDTTSTSAAVTSIVDGITRTTLDFGPGSLSFRRTVPVQLYSAVAVPDGPLRRNLLSVSFQAARLTSNGGIAVFSLLASAQAPVFTSDFIDVSGAASTDFLISTNFVSPGLEIAPLDPALTNVSGGRSFATAKGSIADGLPVATPLRAAAPFGPFAGAALSAVPEPTSWAMLLAGLGLVGGALRRHRAPAAGVISAG